MLQLEELKICVVGLGYVGLPLAQALGKQFPVIGFDINPEHIQTLRNGVYATNELSPSEIQKLNTCVELTSDQSNLADCNFFIITVPTPVDENNTPDLTLLANATRTVARYVSPGNVIVYESTVYPGTTEEICGPIIEEVSELRIALSDDEHNDQVFYLGYSPERMNPGDPDRKIVDIVKLTSGSTKMAAELIDLVYKKIVAAGTYKTSSIQIAEASKVIENVQRDVNIALVNEFALIFDKLGLNTNSILEAASTKWNFLPFRPGLVGGHCIGVDPYYLAHRSLEAGYHPEMILASRRINEGMSAYVADRVIRLMLNKGLEVLGAKVLMLGLTFKENCSDVRNSKVFGIIERFCELNCIVEAFDPLVAPNEISLPGKSKMVNELDENRYDAIVVAVAHQEFLDMEIDFVKRLGKKNFVLFDVKSVFDVANVDGAL